MNLSAAAGFAQGRVSLDRPSWASNNAMAFLISAGAGCNSSACQRTAESVDGEGPAAPILRVSYATAAAGGAPPNLVVPGDGYTLAPNQSIVVTFEVTVNSPLAPAFTEITNTATLNTNQQGPFVASAIDDVVRLGVTVEPNNAGFTVAGGAVTYTHFVTNTGQAPDSYALTLVSELGYAVGCSRPLRGGGRPPPRRGAVQAAGQRLRERGPHVAAGAARRSGGDAQGGRL
ncbi:MAG TPA: hypothetical protein VGG06_28695, partial [Thermoanaerobaculia bacterium]